MKVLEWISLANSVTSLHSYNDPVDPVKQLGYSYNTCGEPTTSLSWCSRSTNQPSSLEFLISQENSAHRQCIRAKRAEKGMTPTLWLQYIIYIVLDMELIMTI